MERLDVSSLPRSEAPVSLRRVLNAGAGPRSARGLHPLFRPAIWEEVRLDLDADAWPDVVGSVADMRAEFPDESFDAIWSSHVLEHLAAHEVPTALLEFRRVLRPDGFAIISSPDLEAVAAAIGKHGIDHVLYTSPAGPIAALDILYGHRASIERGKTGMAHRTGFSCASLGRLLVAAGFDEVLATQNGFDLWALAFREQADRQSIQQELASAGLGVFAGAN
jgi:SAM-dependent methyltransferase